MTLVPPELCRAKLTLMYAVGEEWSWDSVKEGNGRVRFAADLKQFSLKHA